MRGLKIFRKKTPNKNATTKKEEKTIYIHITKNVFAPLPHMFKNILCFPNDRYEKVGAPPPPNCPGNLPVNFLPLLMLIEIFASSFM